MFFFSNQTVSKINFKLPHQLLFKEIGRMKYINLVETFEKVFCHIDEI